MKVRTITSRACIKALKNDDSERHSSTNPLLLLFNYSRDNFLEYWSKTISRDHRRNTKNMPRIGLLNPKNAAPELGRFKEGVVEVTKSYFAVHKDEPRENQESRPAIMALVWEVTRLDDDLTPLLQDDGEAPVTEKLVFSLGGKSLGSFHPGNGDTADDAEVEDLGAEPGTQGNTVFVLVEDAQLNTKSGVMKLFNSLKKQGLKDEIVNRTWAPDYVGGRFFMSSEVSDEKMERPVRNKMTGKDEMKSFPIVYKVVSKIVRTPGSKGSGVAPNLVSAPGKSGKNGSNEIEGYLKPILEAMSTDHDGQKMTRKAFSKIIAEKLQKSKVDTKHHVNVLALAKDDGWLTKHADKFDMKINAADNVIGFGDAEV